MLVPGMSTIFAALGIDEATSSGVLVLAPSPAGPFGCGEDSEKV